MSGRAFVLDQLEGRWEKLFACVVWKLRGKDGVTLSVKDFQAMQAGLDEGGLIMLTWGHVDSFEFRFVTPAEAERLTRHVEGLGGSAEKPS